ncbi:MAG: substrate-binding domain-containing protein [Candidatus Omnitrophota bacterium]
MKIKNPQPRTSPILARPRSYSVALAIPRFEDMFASFYAIEIIKGVGVACSRLELDFSIHVTNKGKKEQLFEKKVFDVEQFDGVLFADINGDIELLEKIRARKMPHIVMNNFFPDKNISCVGIDNTVGGYQATKHLIDLGHRDIATITGNLTTQAGAHRLMGYKKALKEANIPVKEEYIFEGDFIRKGAREAAKDIFTANPRPSAVFCASDLMAAEALSALEQKGLKVPGDISIVGFDNSPIASSCHVPLTSIEQPLFEMARQATESLSAIIQNKHKAPVKVLLPTKLIKRSSTKIFKG